MTVLPVIQGCILQAICHLKSNAETCSGTAWKPGVLLSAVFIRRLNIGLTARCGKSSTKEMWKNEKYRKKNALKNKRKNGICGSVSRTGANILSGQIRNNIDCRVCGKADNMLSQIILDSTAAAEQIPKDAAGRFLLHDGTIFQAFRFDDTDM